MELTAQTTDKVKPGYRMTEVGVIPEDWGCLSIENICLPNGIIRGPFGGTLKKAFFVNSGYKVYEQKNAIYGNTYLGTYYIDESKYNSLKRFAVQAGDFIISCSGTIGKIFRIPQDAPEGVINQALLLLRINGNVLEEDFFFQYFNWDNFQAKIIDNTQGGAMKNLVGMAVFRETKLPAPPITEQKGIATALSDVDDLIASLDRLIAKKRAIKQGVIQELLIEKKQLPGFHNTWTEVNLGSTSVLKARIGWQGLTTAEYLSQGDYFLVTGTDFKNNSIDWNNCHYVSRDRYMQDKYIQVRSKDVLVTKDGTIGKIAFVRKAPKPATLNSGVFVIRPVNNAYDPEYLFYILSSKYFDDFLKKLSAGSTISHLYQKDFVHFSFPAPSDLEEQKAIAAILRDMDAEIEILEARRNKTQALKQGMMQQLLTGKIRLV